MGFKMRKLKVFWGISCLTAVLMLSGCSMKTGELKNPETVHTEAPLIVEDTLPPETALPEETKVPETELSVETVQPVSRKEPPKVKGIYITGPVAGHEKMESLIQLVEETELNTMVIDIKNDAGEITYKMESPTVAEIGSGVGYVRDMPELVKRLKEKGIYVIGRVVAFKDPILAEKRPELSLKTKEGKIFRDKAGLAWVNPYETGVWDYLIEIGSQAAELGFDEIQFDYIRFSTDSGMKNVDFGEKAKEKSKEEIITEFAQYARQMLEPLGVYVSADVYGTIIHNEEDAQIVGQNYKAIAEAMDYICPMVYPSHYNNGVLGVERPEAQAYEIIKAEMEESKKVLSDLEEEKQGAVRVWIQDFSATWIEGYTRYTKEKIREQIQAVYDSGYEEWILWNARNNYTEGALERP